MNPPAVVSVSAEARVHSAPAFLEAAGSAPEGLPQSLTPADGQSLPSAPAGPPGPTGPRGSVGSPDPAGPPGDTSWAAGLRLALEDEVLARATWSRLTEPADVAASALVTVLGAREALSWLLQEGLTAQGTARQAPSPPLPVRGERARATAWWARAVGRWAPRLHGLDVRRELDVLGRLGGVLLIPSDPLWPSALDALDQPPHCLWARGEPRLLTGGSRSPQSKEEGPEACGSRALAGPGSGHLLSLVGSRACTTYGERAAGELAAGLTQRGAVVVSGGAYGIDTAAHRGALGRGLTVAVSAGGVDRLYPEGNASLLRAVIEQGALVAEVPPGCQPARHRFLTRNRVIAALSEATVVVEAAWRSGALSTARHARDLGRELGAVPGPVTSMESVGCHRLLREGAVCVTDADEALELVVPLGSLDPDSDKAADPVNAGSGLLDGLDAPTAAVLDAMPARALASLEPVARAAGLSEREAAAALGLLELGGRVEREGDRWRRRRQG